MKRETTVVTVTRTKGCPMSGNLAPHQIADNEANPLFLCWLSLCSLCWHLPRFPSCRAHDFLRFSPAAAVAAATVLRANAVKCSPSERQTDSSLLPVSLSLFIVIVRPNWVWGKHVDRPSDRDRISCGRKENGRNCRGGQPRAGPRTRRSRRPFVRRQNISGA